MTDTRNTGPPETKSPSLDTSNKTFFVYTDHTSFIRRQTLDFDQNISGSTTTRNFLFSFRMFDRTTTVFPNLQTNMLGKKSFTCSICQCKHQSARGQQCKMFKGTLPIFTSYVRKFDASRETSFARNTDESLESVFAIRRIMAFMHSNTDAFRTWSEQNPIAEVALESSVVSSSSVSAPHVEEPEEENPAQFLFSRPVPPPSTAPAQQAGKEPAVMMANHSSTDKGPAPPTLSYEFLSRAPKITALVLKR